MNQWMDAGVDERMGSTMKKGIFEKTCFDFGSGSRETACFGMTRGNNVVPLLSYFCANDELKAN